MNDNDDDTPVDRRQATMFKPGQSGNPHGRKKGSRNRFGEDFIAALHEDFERHGKAAIERVREEKPADYMKVCASILPKELRVTAIDEGMTDAQLAARIAVLLAETGDAIREAGRAEGTPGGAADPKSVH